jgi:predicted permease
MQTFVQDLRHGLRALIKSPGFASVAILTLALGVGANAAIFSVLQAVVLRQLPYHDPDRIAVLWTKNIRQNLPDGSSYLNFRDWKEQSKEFEDMTTYIRPEFTRGTLGDAASTERIQLAEVGPSFFQLLGAAPTLGRMFEAGDHNATPKVVIISHSLWRQRFAADPQVIGKTVPLDGATMEIVGVMPQEFAIPSSDIQLWRPFFFGPNWLGEGARGADALVVLGRLKPSSSIAIARSEMDAITARLREQYPSTNASLGVTTDPLVDRVVGQTTQRSLWLLFGSVAFVLLIACANVASLVLARAATRRHEFSLRTSLGATKMRLVRQALTENLVLAVLAGAVGLVIAWGGTVALRSLAPGALPRAESIQLNGGVLLFLLGASILSGLIAGVIPALQLSTTKPAEVLNEAGPRQQGGRSSRRIHQALVIGEIALAVILLCGAGLLIRSFMRVQGANRGFDSKNVLLMQIDLPRSYSNQEKRNAFFTEAARRIRSLPGVVAVGAIRDFFIHRQPDYRVVLEGQPPQRPDDPAPPLTEDQVMPGYFEAMRIPLLRGRLIQDSDLAPGAPQVIVINEEMGRRYWPGQDPIGKKLKYGFDPGSKLPWKTVIGVVADMRRQRLDEPAIPYMFQPGIVGEMDIAVRTLGDPSAARDAIRAEIRNLDPSVPPYGIITVEQRLGRTVALRRLQTMLLVALASVALILSVIGAYAVIHQSVAARRQEIGIRMALGANAPTVRRMVLTAGLTPAIAGLALGLLGSFALSRTLVTFLYETNPLDPVIYVAVPTLLLAVTAVACLVPARRASRFDPMIALRNQ